MKRFAILAPFCILGACTSAFNGVSDALDVNGFDQRLAFSATVPQPGGGGDTSVIKGAAMNATGGAALFRSVFPFDDRLTFVDALVWNDAGSRLAAQVHEVIPGNEFDKWVFVYSRALETDLAKSDDNIAGDMTRDCVPIQTPVYQDLVDEAVAEGVLPAGSIVKFSPGSGLVIGGSFQGWLTEDSFVASIENEPTAFVEEPGGVVNAGFLANAGLGSLGSVINVYGTYTLNGSFWALTACSEFEPLIPARAPALQDVTISDGTVGAAGDLLLAGAPLLNEGGNPLGGTDGAEQVDGPY